ncbi:hypothetical protein ES703_58771 [subsurface metagenome]
MLCYTFLPDGKGKPGLPAIWQACLGLGSRLKTMNIAASQTSGVALYYANPNNPEPCDLGTYQILIVVVYMHLVTLLSIS